MIIGYAVRWGIPALNSFLAAVRYYAIMKALSLIRRRDRVVFAETGT